MRPTRLPSLATRDSYIENMVPLGGIEPPTFPLPRERNFLCAIAANWHSRPDSNWHYLRERQASSPLDDGSMVRLLGIEPSQSKGVNLLPSHLAQGALVPFSRIELNPSVLQTDVLGPPTPERHYWSSRQESNLCLTIIGRLLYQLSYRRLCHILVTLFVGLGHEIVVLILIHDEDENLTNAITLYVPVVVFFPLD